MITPEKLREMAKELRKLAEQESQAKVAQAVHLLSAARGLIILRDKVRGLR